MADVGVLLPVRIETRFKDGDLWVRVIPDEPWFLRDDPRISAAELLALRRYTAAPRDPAADGIPAAWRDLAAQVGPARAVHLHRQFVTEAADGILLIREPEASEIRTEPSVPRISGFPTDLIVWLSDGNTFTEVLHLTVERTRLLADFADPNVPGDRRWWEDWDEAVIVGVAGIVPAAQLPARIDALYVTGLGDGDPAEHFADLAAEGRLGLLEPGTPTNSVDGAPAAPLAGDAATWWHILHSPPGDADTDVSHALTGDPSRLSNMPGGERPQRAPTSALTSVLWPALWGFAASHVFDLADLHTPARWAAAALFPEGAYPTLRIGPQPYGLLPTTSWTAWEAADGDPPFEPALIRALVVLRNRHARSARARGTAAGKNTEGLLDLIADTPTSSQFRYRPAWPLELWWLAMTGSGVPERWRTLHQAWSNRYPLPNQLGLAPSRRYGARGSSRRIGVPLVVPRGVAPDILPDLFDKLADAAVTTPSVFANTARVEADVLNLNGSSLLIRLAIRSLQLLIAEVQRAADQLTTFDPEPFARNDRQPGRLEQLIAANPTVDPTAPKAATQHLIDVAAALRSLGAVPASELERRLAAAIDCSNHRIDPWLVAPAQRRLDTLQHSGAAQHRLGAYGWVDGLAPGHPGPTPAGLLHAPTTSAAIAAAVLRDRAVSDASSRWHLDITSRTARAADRLAEHVRIGAHLAEALGREVERIVKQTPAIEQLRRNFPVRTEHAGKRVCDGLRILAQQTFPIPGLDPDQQEALQELRDGLDAYGDLLVADGIHHLVEGRPDVAGSVMDAAAGLSRPPELSLLRTPREGRAVTSSIVLALEHVADTPLPASDSDRAVLSPAGTLDPSVAAYLAAETGPASAWEFEVSFSDGTLPARPNRTVRLADLVLEPADALTLTRTRLEALAVERAAELDDVDLGATGATGSVVGGSAGIRYEQAVSLVGLIGRNPAGPRALSQETTADPASEGIDASLLTRYAATREVGAALARQLRAQVELLSPDGQIGAAAPDILGRLVTACAGWGIAPNPPRRPPDPAAPAPPEQRRLRRLADTATLALAPLDERLAAAPGEPAAGQLPRADFLDAAAALITPTGQVAYTGTTPASDLPAVEPVDGEDGLDPTWLTVVAAVRPPLGRLEAHQLTTSTRLRPWTNRPGDPWQTDPSDKRRLVAVYAVPQLDLATTAPRTPLAVAAVDRFSEVIPAAEQTTGAAFGFDAPAARPQQAILLAVPPVTTDTMDHQTLVHILADTRTLAHARMARPVDLDDQFWALAPTGLLPMSGSIATLLEERQ
jgi:hypothetical protein